MVELKVSSRTHPKFDELLTSDDHLRALYEGDIELAYDKDEKECRRVRRDTGRQVYTSRSEAEQALVTLLCQKRFNDSEIREIMSGCRIGEWQEKGEAYHDKTLMNAIMYIILKDLLKVVLALDVVIVAVFVFMVVAV